MSSREPLILAVAGLGGFARGVTETIRRFGAKTDPPVRLAAVCDPALDHHADRVAELAGDNIAADASFDALVARPEIEAVWLPVPIALHRPFTEQALAAGKAVMCEKPAAATVEDVDAMIAARDRAGLPALLGFQHIYDPAVAQLKQRLLDGAIGTVRRASVYGCWPRSNRYFERAGWAGRLKADGQWVLDSPIQNAMAHPVNLALFLLGDAPQASAQPVAIEAELYRAAPIENYDTISARVRMASDVSLLVLLTHATAEREGPVLRIEGDAGTATWRMSEGAVIENAQGTEHLAPDETVRAHSLQAFARLVRGKSTSPCAVATLETGRAHTLVVNGASEAAPIVAAPPDAIERVEPEQDGEWFASLHGINAAMRHCASQHEMLHESGALPFTEAAGERDLRDYRRFAGPHPDSAAPAAAPSSAP